jgi:hypothetical protein
MSQSPYSGIPQSEWPGVTNSLVARFPLRADEMIEIATVVWDDIFRSTIGRRRARIGVDLFPSPQIMATLLHELFSIELAARHPRTWRRPLSAADKDCVHIRSAVFSFEIKCSSHKSQVFGNRSFAQETTRSKKEKSGYYLAVNFDAFPRQASAARAGANPGLRLIRFGWLDAEDWTGQTAASGQQARLSPAVYALKLPVIWRSPTA